ncbi:hypothetical protein JCM17846_28060 [Iodidimonas nitroreducens]|uniref:Uncharacterized protein n=1 Tax=Iodidimonas nitroreducens TaxID=1236968 RepID=A0A5A7NBN9_9PROT|nr:hypothetical protein JCM17846_28060 [Iodidimonas nitroreducens]
MIRGISGAKCGAKGAKAAAHAEIGLHIIRILSIGEQKGRNPGGDGKAFQGETIAGVKIKLGFGAVKGFDARCPGADEKSRCGIEADAPLDGGIFIA